MKNFKKPSLWYNADTDFLLIVYPDGYVEVGDGITWAESVYSGAMVGSKDLGFLTHLISHTYEYVSEI